MVKQFGVNYLIQSVPVIFLIMLLIISPDLYSLFDMPSLRIIVVLAFVTTHILLWVKLRKNYSTEDFGRNELYIHLVLLVIVTFLIIKGISTGEIIIPLRSSTIRVNYDNTSIFFMHFLNLLSLLYFLIIKTKSYFNILRSK